MALWFLSGSLVTPTSGKILSAYPNEPSLQKREIPDISRDLIQQKFRLRADRQCYRNFFWAEQRKQKNFVEKVIRQKKIFEEECQVSNPSSSPVSLSTFLFAFWVGWTLSYFFFKFVYLHPHTRTLAHSHAHTHTHPRTCTRLESHPRIQQMLLLKPFQFKVDCTKFLLRWDVVLV